MQPPPARIYALMLLKRQMQPCKIRSLRQLHELDKLPEEQLRKWYTNKTAGNDQKQTAIRKCIYNHDTAVDISRQSLLLITRKKLELIPEAKAVKCTYNPFKSRLEPQNAKKTKDTRIFT